MKRRSFGNDGTLYRYLVKWTGFGHEHNTWVDESAFEHRTLIDAYWTTQTERREDNDA
jgi:hypothetical protein